MKMEVVGVGERRAGTSKKTGQPYDGTTLYCLKESKEVDGHATKEIYLNHLRDNYPAIAVGDMINVDYNDGGFIEDVTVID